MNTLLHRGEVINGGFGLMLDGSDEAAKRASTMLNWDVSNGVRVCMIASRPNYNVPKIISGWL